MLFQSFSLAATLVRHSGPQTALPSASPTMVKSTSVGADLGNVGGNGGTRQRGPGPLPSLQQLNQLVAKAKADKARAKGASAGGDMIVFFPHIYMIRALYAVYVKF